MQLHHHYEAVCVHAAHIYLVRVHPQVRGQPVTTANSQHFSALQKTEDSEWNSPSTHDSSLVPKEREQYVDAYNLYTCFWWEDEDTIQHPSQGNIASLKVMNIFVPREMLTHFNHLICNSAVMNVVPYIFSVLFWQVFDCLYFILLERPLSALCLESAVLFCLSRVVRLSWCTSAILYLCFSVVMCHVWFSLPFLYLLYIAVCCFLFCVPWSVTPWLLLAWTCSPCVWSSHRFASAALVLTVSPSEVNSVTLRFVIVF